MLQAVLIRPGQMEFQEAEIPKPGPDEILMKVERIGICGSDIHAYHGLHPRARYPLILGHESSGTVYQIGENVRSSQVKPGDKITFMPQFTCGECYLCRHDKKHLCESLRVMGIQPPGAAQEYFILPAENVVKLPDKMDFDLGAMVEPVAVAVHAVSRAPKIKDQKIIVLGAGPIGNLVGQVAKSKEAGPVLITDVSDFRLELARRCGLDFAINSQREDLAEAIQRYLGPDRADVIFECVGVEATVEQAVNVARKDTSLVILGVFGKKLTLDFLLVQSKELKLFGSHMYWRSDYEQAMELITANKLNLRPLITTYFNFTSYPAAFEYIDGNRDRAMKVMITMGTAG